MRTTHVINYCGREPELVATITMDQTGLISCDNPDMMLDFCDYGIGRGPTAPDQVYPKDGNIFFESLPFHFSSLLRSQEVTVPTQKSRPMASSPTSRAAERARLLLGDDRVLAFLRWTRPAAELDDRPRPSACRFINDELEAGETLDQLFSTTTPGANNGYFLKAKWVRAGCCQIEFGCHAGMDCGDGGEWIVTFSDAGEVVEGEMTSFWMC
jgi:hypothetical protein